MSDKMAKDAQHTAFLPLSTLAKVTVGEGFNEISRDNGKRGLSFNAMSAAEISVRLSRKPKTRSLKSSCLPEAGWNGAASSRI